MSGFLQCSGDDLEFGIAGDRGISQLPASLGALASSQVADTFINTTTGAIIRRVRDELAKASEDQLLTLEQANERGQVVSLTFDGSVTAAYVELRIAREQNRLFRQAVLQRPESEAVGDLMRAAAAGLATFEPANLALTFFAWPVRFGGPVVTAAVNSLMDFAATEAAVELQNQSEGHGRDVETFLIDMLTSAGLDVFFEGLFIAFKAGELDEVLERQVGARGSTPAQQSDRLSIGDAAEEVAEAAGQNVGKGALQRAASEEVAGVVDAVQPFSTTPAPVVNVDKVVRQATSFTRNLEHMSAKQRADLLNRTSAALASGQLPQHDEILLLMRLLDQDNEINRRPPNSGFGSGPTR